VPTKKQIPYHHGVFFITFTCYRWLHLFETTNSYGSVYKWFDHLKSKGNYIISYVIMPNHMHLLIGFRNSGKSLNNIVGNGKRFIAYEIVNRLQAQGNEQTLQQMAESVNYTDRKRSKLHEVWEGSFDWKECSSKEMMAQKINYIHNNPCKGKWKLAESPASYLHSSADYYLTGTPGIYPVTSFMEMDDVDLSGTL
jgi:REP element-mobilizing transposase RayT